MKKALALGLSLALSALAACREHGRPDPDVRMAPSHDVEPAAEKGQEKGGQAVPTRLEIPPEVQSAYSGVRVAWKDKTTGKEAELAVPLGGTARIPASDLELRADAYLPAFSMTAEAITSSGIEEENPAARIGVLEKGKEIFAGWIFTRFPDVHPFEHPRYALKLVGGVRKAAPKK